ncbi:enediyne biosynthesis protein [Acrocarpospora phusangensis]|uniref:Enediyne biosynthesis protein n=2 Tax=Acrocarpospora phusangensis TaxID=1070424 RepID=A0A919Q4S7_9ACTN|nr:enediyne biosynthesis protein [Acrocarpospora phusangensis]
MANMVRALRRKILTPDMSATRLDVRGFHEKSPAAKELLETVGRSFLTGFAYAAEARTPADAEELLEGIPRRFRGFAYEGAGMAFTIVDALPFGGRGRLRGFLEGRGKDHIYMVYVGVGWAMARLPRAVWSRVEAPDPLLRWLALDGFGFHQAYFQTAKYVHGQFQEPNFPWPRGDHGDYPNRAIDQGVGRAMWFVGGTDAALVASMIEKFPEHRRADLYAGTGLAATYAGGASEAELRGLWDRAGEHRPLLAQGSAFGATARVQAGLLGPHTELATRVFCGVTPEKASLICAEALPDGPLDGDPPGYEVWRQRIAEEFVSLGRC